MDCNPVAVVNMHVHKYEIIVRAVTRVCAEHLGCM